MSIAIPIEELYFLMGANAIGFVPESPLHNAFEEFSRTPKDLNAEKLSIQLFAKGFIKSTETLKPTQDMGHRIGIVADPDALYSVMSRIYDRIFYSHFYEKEGEIVEFSCKKNDCHFNEVRTRSQFTQSISTVINGTKKPEIPSLSFTIPEYVLLGTAFRFQDISDMTGPLETTGKPMHFTVSDIREEIGSNSKSDIIDALSPLGSGYTHAELTTDPSLFRKVLERLIAKGFIAWVDPQKELLSVGPAAQQFYQLMMKPSALFISIAASNLRTYDWKNTLSFFWSDRNLFEIGFEDNTITFTGIEKEQVPGILSGRVLFPVHEKPVEKKKVQKEIPTAAEKPRTAGFCPKCGWKNERGASFCPRCGKSLKRS
jgi:hypothetical protein